MKDFNMACRGHVFSDSSAAFGLVKRKGLGRTRHVQTAYLWVQDAAESKALEYGKVLGTENCADPMAKPLTPEYVDGFCSCMCCNFLGGEDDGIPDQWDGPYCGRGWITAIAYGVDFAIETGTSSSRTILRLAQSGFGVDVHQIQWQARTSMGTSRGTSCVGCKVGKSHVH